MKRPYLGWYVLIAILALAPTGARMLSWRVTRSQEVDAAMAEAGQTLFTHMWKPKDPLSPGGDGLGPVFNANSCVACHHQGGLGGSGGLEHNVTTFAVRPEANGGTAREGVVHAFATKTQFKESLAQVDRTM